jgi:hypothetical protein
LTRHDRIFKEFEDYLRTERGLAPLSIIRHLLPIFRPFSSQTALVSILTFLGVRQAFPRETVKDLDAQPCLCGSQLLKCFREILPHDPLSLLRVLQIELGEISPDPSN